MKKLQYSPDSLEKLHEIKKDITARYGAEKAKTVIRETTKAFRDLQQFESKGLSVENLIGIPCDYRVLYVQYNYAFYCIEDNVIRITDIFNEREDFLWKLFGIKTTAQETENYWGGGGE